MQFVGKICDGAVIVQPIVVAVDAVVVVGLVELDGVEGELGADVLDGSPATSAAHTSRRAGRW
jgi:hypothetical protein